MLLKVFVYWEWKKSSDNNEKPSIVYYRPFMVVLFFIFKNEGQWLTFWFNNGLRIFFENTLKF